MRTLKIQHIEFRLLWMSGLMASLLLCSAETAQAQLSDLDAQSSRQIEQPLSMKLGMTAAGTGLIGLELWWFLFGGAVGSAKLTKADKSRSTARGKLSGGRLNSRRLSSGRLSEKESSTETLGQYRSLTALSPEQMTTLSIQNICSLYNGIQLPSGVLTAESKPHPRFSASLG